MATLPPPPAPPRAASSPPAPPPPQSRPNGAAAPAARGFTIARGRQVGGQRVLVYGPGGVGKTELCSLIPGALFLDLEDGSRSLDVARVSGIESFADVRALLHSSEVDKFPAVVIDTGTKLEELALADVIATVPHEKPGVKITSIESYGFGKGYRHLYDRFSLVLQDSDRLVRAGKHVVLVTHSCTAEAPNPTGDNWLRYEPRLQHPKKENSIRERVFGWADHVLFCGYDVATNEGKGVGSGTRTIYTQELPSHVAKTRGAHDEGAEVPASLPYTRGDATIWSLILGGAK